MDEQTINEQNIPGGCILLARQIVGSELWLKPPQYLKLFVWIVGSANHAEKTRNGHTYKRGELVTTYADIIKAMIHYRNREQIAPTPKQVRQMLEWFVSRGMITCTPLRASGPRTGNPPEQEGFWWAGETGGEPVLTREHPPRATREYVGIKIVVVNYDTYQTLENYKGAPQKGDLSEQGHNNNNESKKDIYIVRHGTEKIRLRDGVNEVLNLLNEEREKLAGRKLRPITSDSNIIARLKAGGSVYEACRIILTKAQDPHFKEHLKYFHPDTLFRRSHWEKYLDEAELLRGGNDGWS